MGWSIFSQNLLESAAAVTATPAAATASPVTRLYDRGKTFQYLGGSAAQTDLDIDLGSAVAVTALAILNHNITGVTISIRADSTSPAATARSEPTAVEKLRRPRRANCVMSAGLAPKPARRNR